MRILQQYEQDLIQEHNKAAAQAGTAAAIHNTHDYYNNTNPNTINMKDTQIQHQKLAAQRPRHNEVRPVSSYYPHRDPYGQYMNRSFYG
jgi:hypothetical protein